MLGSMNRFSLTRAAYSTSGQAKGRIPVECLSISLSLFLAICLGMKSENL